MLSCLSITGIAHALLLLFKIFGSLRVASSIVRHCPELSIAQRLALPEFALIFVTFPAWLALSPSLSFSLPTCLSLTLRACELLFAGSCASSATAWCHRAPLATWKHSLAGELPNYGYLISMEPLTSWSARTEIPCISWQSDRWLVLEWWEGEGSEEAEIKG